MKNTGINAMFSSKTELWETPQALFESLDREFHFTVDSCATPENAKCPLFFTPELNGLSQNWGGHTVWCNPPYGPKIKDWVEKASREQHNGTTTVMLVPARTDTKWFHDYVYLKPNVEIRFLRGRLKFGTAQNNAPFPSMIIIFRKENHT